MGGGGTAPSQTVALPAQVQASYDALIGNSDDMPFTLMEALTDAGAMNPWALINPYNPTERLDALHERLDEINENVDLVDPALVSTYIEDAATVYDAEVLSDAALDALAAAREAATEGRFLRSVSGQEIGMWMMGSYMTTQFGQNGYLAAAERSLENSLYRAQLEAGNLSTRSAAIVQIASEMARLRMAEIQTKQAAFGSEYELARLFMTVNDDYYQRVIEHNVRKRTWKFTLLNDAQGQIMSITGAQLVPRALTKAEAATARMGTAINTALQFGAATSPMAGIAAGALSLGIQGIGDRFNG